MHEQDGYSGRSDARDARRLSDRRRPDLREFLPHFIRQSGDGGVVEVLRQPGFLVAPLARDFFFLAFDVTGVFGGDLELRADLPCQSFIRRRGRRADQFDDIVVANFRPT